MWDAEILSVMQKLDSWTASMADRLPEYEMENLREVKHEMSFIVDFISRSQKKSQYLISEVAEIGSRALDGTSDLSFVVEDLRETKERMIHLADAAADYPMRCEGGDGEEDLVGTEQVEFLLEEAIFVEESGLYTTCIAGMRGAGKTTLARQVYNHPYVVSRFKHRAWLRLSAELTRKEALIKLIRQLNVELEGDDEKMDSDTLRNMLRQHLRCSRYFIVLDDVHPDSYLEYVFSALQYAGRGSRLLLTSLDVNIDGEYIDYDHKMVFLNGDESWKLLVKTISYGCGGDKIPKKLEKQGRKMVTKCNGLPLAIKELGNHWAKRRLAGMEWGEVIESIDFNITLSALELSYATWESETKLSFFYLGFFKEGTTIMTRKLTQIYSVAEEEEGEEEGEEEEEEEEEVEEEEEEEEEEKEEEEEESHAEVGDDFEYEYQTCGYDLWLEKLMGESVLEAKDELVASLGEKSYRINTLFHMLSMRKVEEDHCHRVIYCCWEKANHFTNEDKHLRTLFFHGGGYLDEASSWWESLKLLRILDFEGFGLKTLPKNIGTRTKLRFLGLNNNYIKEFPHPMGCQKNLEVLDFEQNFMVEVPDIIRKMDYLRHLYMSDIICQKPLKIDALRALLTLTYISVDNWKYNASSLKMMTSLRKLGIEGLHGNSNARKLLTSLALLENLKQLILRGFRFRAMPCLDKLRSLRNLFRLKLDGRLSSLPSANSFPPGMAFLTLVNSLLDEDPMPVLEKLSILCYLKLRNAYTGRQMVISDKGFIGLRTLCMEELWHLSDVHVGESAMRHLSRFEINSCPYLETFPKEMVSMRFLEKLKIVTAKRIATKIRELALFSKIENVDIHP